jgi:protein-disulfide isomerase
MTIACSAGLVMFWFVGLQVAVIGSFCVYCLADHTLGLLAVACLLLYAHRAGVHAGIAQWALSLVLAGAFVAAHVVFAPTRIHIVETGEPDPIEPGAEVETLDSTETNPVADEAPAKPSRMVSLQGGKVRFDIYEIPHIGASEAEFVIMELFDYTCSHCRDLHPHLHNALERYGDQLAIVTLPVPMSGECNPYIRITQPVHQHACTYATYSMAVRTYDHDKYVEYHDWLMEGKQPPTPEAARARAVSLLGAGNFETSLTNRFVQGWLDNGRAMYRVAKAGSIPKLFIGSRIANIPHTTSENLFEFIESTLAIKPVASDE